MKIFATFFLAIFSLYPFFVYSELRIDITKGNLDPIPIAILKFNSSKQEENDLSKNINALADAHYLPYGDKYFDQVIIQAVLEHVISPRKVVSEIYRVLNIGGIVYSEVPFLQSVHEGPYDFFRFTHSGHRWLFRDFQEISSGALQGGFSSLLFISSYTISGLFRNRYIGIIIRMFLSKLCALLDRLVGKRWNIDIACGSFFLGKKENNYLNKKDASWIKNYYKVRSI